MKNSSSVDSLGRHSLPGSLHSHSDPPKFHSHKGMSNGTLDLWRDGLLCAYEFIPGQVKKINLVGEFGHQSGPVQGRFDAEISLKHPQVKHEYAALDLNRSHDSFGQQPEDLRAGSLASGAGNLSSEVQGFVVRESLRKDKDYTVSPSSSVHGTRSQGRRSKRETSRQWIPIGWNRLTELFQNVQIDPEWPTDSEDDESLSVADLAHPYWQLRAGPTFWCHIDARHPKVQAWLWCAQCLHPAVSAALRDERRLISDRMKHLLYEVPVRVAGGLLFELVGQSLGDPVREEEDIPVVLRSWQAQNFLITSMHVKGIVHNLNVLGVLEVQDLVGAGGAEAPKSVQEVIAQLASRLARWDDRMSRKHYFGAADEVELKYVNRRSNEDLALLSIILNQEICRLATQVIRVKWSLHAREEILHELSTHLKEGNARKILEKVHQNTRDMLEEQEAVRERLFTVQDVMQSNVREKLQEKSVRITHNLAVIGGGGLLLSIVVGLFGINVDGIPGSQRSPYAFAIFCVLLFLIGASTIGLGMMRLGFKKPPSEEAVLSRKMELQELVHKFQKAAEAHEKVHHMSSYTSLPEEDVLNTSLDQAQQYYVLMH